MRRIFLTLAAALLLCLPCAAQNPRYIEDLEVGNTLKVSGAVNLWNGSIALTVGADSGASTRTNATDKYARIGAAHYLNAEEPVALLRSVSSSSANAVSIGGGGADMNAATSLSFYTGATSTTTTGTQRLTIDSSGNATFSGSLGAGAFTATQLTINNAGADLDSRIAGDTDANLVYTDAGNDRVGIGTAGPDRKLDILDATNPQLRLTKTDGTDWASFRADAGVLYLRTHSTSVDTFAIGSNDTVRGSIAIYGHATGSTAGGSMDLLTAADHDGTINSYQLQASSDDLLIGPSTDTDSLQYDGGTDIWSFTGAGVNVNGNSTLGNGQGDLLTVNGTAKIDTGATENLPALHLKQDDTNEPFIKFEGGSEAGTNQNISTWTTGGAIQRFLKIDVGGTAYWVPAYSAPTG